MHNYTLGIVGTDGVFDLDIEATHFTPIEGDYPEWIIFYKEQVEIARVATSYVCYIRTDFTE